MSRISSLSTPVSERMKLFDKDSTPKKIPSKCTEKPVKESPKGLDTPKLRPVPRSQFTIKEPPPGVKAYLNPKLSSPVTKTQEAQKTDLKASKSESPSSSGSNVSKTDQTRATRVRSTSTPRPAAAAGASKATTPEKTTSARAGAVTNKKAATTSSGVGAIKKTPGETPAAKKPTVTRSGSIRTPSVTRTPSISRGEASGASGLPVTRTRAPSVTRTDSVTSVSSRTRAPSVTRTDSAQSVTSRTRAPSVTRTPSITRTPSMSSSSSVSSSRGTKALTTRSSSKNVLESAKKSAEKRQDKETVVASAGPVTGAEVSSESPSPGATGPGADNTDNTQDKNTLAISTPVKSPDTTKITTAEIVPTPVSDAGLSLFSTEKTIEFERKTFNSSTLPRKVSNTSVVSETMVEVQRSVSDTQVDEVKIAEVKDCGDEEYKAEAVIFRKDSASADRKESVGDIIRKISELNEVIVKEDNSEAEDDRKKSVTKVAEENNDSIVKSDDDDNDDDDEDIDNDSVEDDVQIIQTTQYANKSRKESATSSGLESVIKTDTSSSNNSNRKYSQKFINPFEPPIPELVNKTALIAEFNSVQEENLKNIGFKSLTEESLDGSKEQYFTSQALNNATSTTINQALKLDIEFRDDKMVSGLGTGAETESDTETPPASDLGPQRKLKLDLDTRVRDQEDEVDDLVSQVHMLETSKMRLEMEITQIKKDFRREIQMKEDDIEDIRMNNNKRVKALEAQLETEHEERMGFLREKHDLESKVMNLQDMLERSGDEDLVIKLKRDLKRTKALLRDAQLYMEKNQNDGTNKVIVRQLKNQLEDAEFARSAAIKAKQNSELELADVQIQLDDVMRCKHETEERNLRLTREKADLTSSLAENEEELQEVMRRYKACVGAVSTDQITIQDQSLTIQTLECERNKLREQYAELCQRLDHMEGENVSTVQHKRLELKIRELESKLELERTTKTRMDTQIMRQKELIEKMNREMDDLRLREGTSQEDVKKVSRQLRDLREEVAGVQSRELELSHKKSDLEKQLELAEAETLTVKNELKIALRRIDDLQAAIGGEMDSDFVSDQESDSSDEDMSSFIDNHRRSMSIQRERESILRRRDKPFECISEED